MDWRTRLATDRDAGRLALVGAATFLETFAGTLDGAAIVAHCATAHAEGVYRRFLAEPAGAAWLAEASEGAAPIGYALVAATDLPGSDPAGSDLELKRIYALSRVHGQGVGAELMRLALDHSSSNGAARLLLGVYKGNRRAIAFYRRWGFSEIGERMFAVGGRRYEDVVLAAPL